MKIITIKYSKVILIALMFLVQGCGLSLGNNNGAGSTGATATQITAPEQNTIQHTLVPGAGADQGSFAHDNEESKTFESRSVTNGDDFRFDRFERPFTSQTMDYLPYIDVKDFSMSSDDTWYYVQIQLAGKDTNSSDVGTYGAEFDLDQDGRSDILLVADNPGKDWSTDGVRLYYDKNADVGGFSSSPDDIYTGNGFETLVFDAGKGDDPDLAWARMVDSSALVAEFAVKTSLFGDTRKFLWSVLASATPVDPQRFYFNDTYSEEQAGSPLKGSKFYPLAQIAAFDNTCRVPFGFAADGTEPLGCNVNNPRDSEFSPGKTKITITVNPVNPVVNPAFP